MSPDGRVSHFQHFPSIAHHYNPLNAESPGWLKKISADFKTVMALVKNVFVCVCAACVNLRDCMCVPVSLCLKGCGQRMQYIFLSLHTM